VIMVKDGKLWALTPHTATTLGHNPTEGEHSMESDPDQRHGGHSVLADMVHELGELGRSHS